MAEFKRGTNAHYRVSHADVRPAPAGDALVRVADAIHGELCGCDRPGAPYCDVAMGDLGRAAQAAVRAVLGGRP
jgi:hypothetical protein